MTPQQKAGKTLRTLRKEAKLTQKELGKMTGYTQACVSFAEKGRRANCAANLIEWLGGDRKKKCNHLRPDTIYLRDQFLKYYKFRKEPGMPIVTFLEKREHAARVGDELRALRVGLRYNQTELATLLGYHHSTVSKIETGRIRFTNTGIFFIKVIKEGRVKPNLKLI